MELGGISATWSAKRDRDLLEQVEGILQARLQAYVGHFGCGCSHFPNKVFRDIRYARSVTRDHNPFVYSRPLPPEELIDREAEVERMLGLADGGHFLRLLAPRRYGKTSVLLKVLAEAERVAGMTPVLVDLYGVLGLADVTVRIERAYAAQLKGPIRRRVERFLESTGLGLSLGAYGISVTLQLERRIDPLPALHALLDLPLRAGGEARRVLVAFDEFQDVARVDGLEELLRGHIQHQGDVASYVFSGSEPGMMRLLFEDRARPLYAQAEPLELGRLSDADLAAAIRGRFDATARSAGDVLVPLLRVAAGHPQRSMLLAHRLWDETPRRATADDEHWLRALEKTRAQTDPEFEALWRGFGVSEQRVLRSVSASGGSLYESARLEAIGLKRSTAHDAATRIVAAADLEEDRGRYRFVDPLLEDWIRRELERRPMEVPSR